MRTENKTSLALYGIGIIGALIIFIICAGRYLWVYNDLSVALEWITISVIWGCLFCGFGYINSQLSKLSNTQLQIEDYLADDNKGGNVNENV